MTQFFLAQAPLILATNEQRDWSSTVLTIVAVTFLALTFLYLAFVHAVYWDRGIFPSFMRFTRSNHYEAVLQLTRNIMRHDREAYKEKIDLACEHLRTWFPHVRGAVRNELADRKGDPVSTKSVGYWLNRKGISKNEKHILFEFLFGVAVADGMIGQREYAELKVLATELKLTDSILDELVATFRAQHAERIFEERERRKQFVAVESEGRDRRALEILELGSNPGPDQVKKAYRRLVMKWHPDVVSIKNADEEALAKERFLEIQQAYEYLLGTQID